MLRVKSLTLPNQKTVDFELPSGEALIIRGRNGSGKSLLLKSLAQLCEAPWKEFQFEGQDVSLLNPEEYRSLVLYVSTTPLLMKDETVEEFFTSVLKLHVYKNHSSDFNYQSYLRHWGIENTRVAMLSSGQKQLISILRALTLKAKVLLLDEPTSNLDHDRTIEVEELLLDWKKRTQGSFLMISHGRDQIQRLNLPCVEFESLVKTPEAL
jgi:ABC-type multidrug transport system ATPase subunit